MKLINKTIWITGASSGIGRALAIQFNKEGATCILSGRNSAELELTRSKCAHPEKCQILPFDMTDSNALDRSVELVTSTRTIDILINNAGQSQRSIATETTNNVNRRLMEINFFSVVALTKKVLPIMIKNKMGSIINISSIAGKTGVPYRSGYAASKHALHGYFDSLRAEVSHLGIHVMMVCPGFVNTAIAQNALDSKGEKFSQSDPENENGLSPEEVAIEIIKGLKAKKDEMAIGKFEVNAIRLKRFWPSQLTRMLKNKYLQSIED